jgi:hypothetical protein
MATRDFGAAIRMLKLGHRMARSGWNGKGMWLALIHPDCVAVGSSGSSSFEPGHLTGFGSMVPLLPWIGMKTADDKFVPWLASQTDILAEDWGVVE